MLWEVDIYPAPGEPDRASLAVRTAAAELGLGEHLSVVAAHGYLLQGTLDDDQLGRIARELLVDGVVERSVIARVGEPRLSDPSAAFDSPDRKDRNWQVVHVLPKPGVMDPVAQSALAAIADLKIPVDAVRTLRHPEALQRPRNQEGVSAFDFAVDGRE